MRARFSALPTLVVLVLCTAARSASAQAPADAPAPPPSVGGVTPPVVKSHVDAVYPESAHRASKHGDVVLAVTVDVHGHVSAISVMRSGGDDLDQAAIVAARQWTFEPAMRKGKPVAAKIPIPFHFAPPDTKVEVVEAPAVQGPVQAAGAANAHAHVHDEPAPAGAEGSAAPESVTVRGRVLPPSRGNSDFNVRPGELAGVPRANAAEYLKMSPGVFITNEGGDGHAEQIFMRGFDAGDGQDVELTVGGIPVNEAGNPHGNGYSDTHFIIPELVESLRVLQGPFDPRQGNFAVAGSANYELGLERRGLTAKITGGSWATRRLLLLWGPPGESHHTFGGAELSSTDGFGQNRDSRRASVMGQYEGQLGAHGSYRLFAQGFSTHYHAAGMLREDDYEAGRIGFYDSYTESTFAHQATREGGDASRFSLGGDIESRTGDTTLTQQVFIIKRDMRLLENFTGFALDVQKPTDPPHDQRGDMLDLGADELTMGARGSARIHGAALGQRQELELGYFARQDWVRGSQQRLSAATGAPYLTEMSLDSRLADIGLYGDASVKLADWVSVRGGARSDLLSFDVHDGEADSRRSAVGIAVMPRASLVLGPVQHFSFTTSYGQGVRSTDPSEVTHDMKTPFASVTAYEAGVGYAHTTRSVDVIARSVFFQTVTDADMFFSETAGRTIGGTGTTRTGWAGSFRITGAFFDESANVSVVRATYDDTHLPVTYVPGVIVRSDTSFFTDLPLRLEGRKVRGSIGAGVSYVGPRPLPFGATSENIVTVDSAAHLRWTRYELGLAVTNLLDRKTRVGEYNYVSDFHSQAQPTTGTARHFNVGPPRGVFASFAVTLGGEG